MKRVVVALAALLATAACSSNSPRSEVSPSPSESPAATSSPTPSASSTGTTTVPVYYLGGTDRVVLYREFRSVPRTTEVVRAAVDAMLHLAPLDNDYRSGWPKTASVLGVSISGSTATVDLSGDARHVTDKPSLQQLVYTVTAAAPVVTSVRLRFDGAAGTSAMTRAPQSETLAPVWVVNPRIEASVPAAFTVTGTASVFEATVSWAVTRPGSSAQLAHGFVNATVGGPGRGDYSVKVTLPAGTTGDVVFTAWEASAEDGRVTFPDSKTYRVT